MPYNFKGKYYDLRPYVDETNCVVIRRGAVTGRYKLNRAGKLISSYSGHYHVDAYDKSIMEKQARKLIPILLGKDSKKGSVKIVKQAPEVVPEVHDDWGDRD